MNRMIAIGAVLVMLAGTAGAVLDHNGTGGDAHITGGSSAGASAGVTEGANGSTVEWRAEVAQTGASCLSGNATAVTGVNWTDAEDPNDASADGWRSVSFRGTLEAGTPCHTIAHDVRTTDSGYVLELSTERSGDEACVDCVGGIGYEAEFTAAGPYRLTVVHDNETLETLESPDRRAEGRTGVLGAILSALAGLLPL